MRLFPRTPRSFRTQIVVSTVGMVAFAMVLLALGVQLVLGEVVKSNVARVLEDRADAVISAAVVSPDGKVAVRAGALDPDVIVYDSHGRIAAGGISPDVTDDVAALRDTTQTRAVDVGERYRLLAEPFTLGSNAGQVRGVVVVSEPLSPYENAERYALFASIALGVIVTAAAGLVVLWVTRRALAPVAQMASQAADWSEHDLARRFELGEPTNEIAVLGQTLDRLLERVSMAIRAEQRLTAELAHELRTPLTSIQGAAELALLRGGLAAAVEVDLKQIAASSRSMNQTITALLDLARADTNSASETSHVGQVVARAVEHLAGDTLAIECTAGGQGTRLAAPLDLAVRALGPVVENASRHARSLVRIDAVVAAGHVDIRVDDDGDGIPGPDHDRIFLPGHTGADRGTGLGLAIARRTARSLGGDVTIADPHDGGARFVVRLPRV